MGKSTISMVIFNSKLLNYQRVSHVNPSISEESLKFLGFYHVKSPKSPPQIHHKSSEKLRQPPVATRNPVLRTSPSRRPPGSRHPRLIRRSGFLCRVTRYGWYGETE